MPRLNAPPDKRAGRGWLAGALLALGLRLALAWAVPAQAGSVPVTFALSRWIGLAPFYVAAAEHDFGGYPVQFVNMGTNAAMNAALLNGSVDVANLSMNEVLEDHLVGFDIKVVMPIDYSNGADAIVAQDAITSVAGLRDTTIALDATGYSALLLEYALYKAGFSLRDVTVVNVPGDSVPAELFAGNAGAGVIGEPNVSAVTAKPNFHVLYSSAAAPGLITDNLSTTPAFLRAHPAAIPAILNGFEAGRAFIAAHPEAAFQIIGTALGISAQSAAAQYRQVVCPDLAQMDTMMTGQGSARILPYSANFDLVREMLIQRGIMTQRQRISEADMLDARFVEAAMRAGAAAP